MKSFTLYLLRWQLSTPILALCIVTLNTLDPLQTTMIANLVGGGMFYFVDKRIFKKENNK